MLEMCDVPLPIVVKKSFRRNHNLTILIELRGEFGLRLEYAWRFERVASSI